MIGKLLFKGMMAGVLAGMVAFAFAHHFGEPQVDRAIGKACQLTLTITARQQTAKKKRCLADRPSPGSA
jgi:hypothetical protein